MIKTTNLLLLAFLFCTGLNGKTHAQGENDDKLIVDCIENLELKGTADTGKDIRDKAATNVLCRDLARVATGNDNVPVSPAFTVLNVTPDTVVRPRTPNDFATSLLNGVDPNGNFQQGLALDFNPYLLAAGDTLTLSDYQDNMALRLLARTQLSLATTKGPEDADESARLAIGLHVSPWLESDPKLKGSNLLKCMGTNLRNALMDSPPPPPRSNDPAAKQAHFANLLNRAEAALDPKRSATYNDCQKKYQREAENTSGWTLGAAPSWNSTEGNLGDLEWNGYSLWSSLALNLGSLRGSNDRANDGIGQAVVHVRYTKDEEIENPALAGTFIEQDSLILSGKLRFDGPSGQKGDLVKDMKFSVSAALVDASRDNGEDDTYYQWSADTEFRLPQIASNLFLVISAGTTSGREDDNNSFAGASFKWGFNNTDEKK